MGPQILLTPSYHALVAGGGSSRARRGGRGATGIPGSDTSRPHRCASPGRDHRASVAPPGVALSVGPPVLSRRPAEARHETLNIRERRGERKSMTESFEFLDGHPPADTEGPTLAALESKKSLRAWSCRGPQERGSVFLMPGAAGAPAPKAARRNTRAIKAAQTEGGRLAGAWRPA